MKVTTGGNRIRESDDLSYVNGAEFTSNSDIEIVVITPPGPLGLVDVMVTNPGGRDGSNGRLHVSRRRRESLRQAGIDQNQADRSGSQF